MVTRRDYAAEAVDAARSVLIELVHFKEKDPWDIFYCVRYFPGGIVALAEEFHPYMQHGLVREGLVKVAAAFASVEHVGPVSVADFDEVTDPEDRALLCRDAFERVSMLLGKVGL